MSRRVAVFLDYGGTLTSASSRSLPSEEGVAAIRLVNASGCLAVIVSNQKAVGEGRMTQHELDQLRVDADSAFQAAGARVDGWYFCPHRAEDGCDCRKPLPGLLLQAARELGIDLAASAMVGDRDDRDVQAGRSVGALTGLVLRDALSTRAGIGADIADSSLGVVVEELLRRVTGTNA